MSSPSESNRPFGAEDVLAIIRAMSLAEKKRLAQALDNASNPLWEVGYVAIPHAVLEIATKITALYAKKAIPETLTLVRQLDAELSRRKRKPDEVRLERGRIILEANRDGISWKKMPSHILKAYPDWFPEYREGQPTVEERKRLRERLRRMARDAKKQEE